MGQWAEMVPVKRRGTYGITILRNGVQLRSDGRLRFKRSRPSEWGPEYALRPGGARGKVGGWSEASARRLAFVAANADSTFTSLLTLTYRARTDAWESDAERNRRVIRRSQADRHRFLRCLHGELGHYLWVREFQTRGVVHYHVLCERVITQERATVAWCRATGQLEDEAVLRHGVKVDEVRSQGGALSYVARYLGKERQKQLPVGVEGAGRWWGRSISLRLATVAEVVWLDRAEGIQRGPELTIVRILRRYISRCTRRPYRGGAFLDYGGALSARLAAMVAVLKAFYGETPTFDPYGLPRVEVVEEVADEARA